MGPSHLPLLLRIPERGGAHHTRCHARGPLRSIRAIAAALFVTSLTIATMTITIATTIIGYASPAAAMGTIIIVLVAARVRCLWECWAWLGYYCLGLVLEMLLVVLQSLDWQSKLSGGGLALGLGLGQVV